MDDIGDENTADARENAAQNQPQKSKAKKRKAKRFRFQKAERSESGDGFSLGREFKTVDEGRKPVYLTPESFEIFQNLNNPHYDRGPKERVQDFNKLMSHFIQMNRGEYLLDVKSNKDQEDHRDHKTGSAPAQRMVTGGGQSFVFVKNDLARTTSFLSFHHPHDDPFVFKEYRKQFMKMFSDFDIREEDIKTEKLPRRLEQLRNLSASSETVATLELRFHNPDVERHCCRKVHDDPKGNPGFRIDYSSIRSNY